MNILILDNYDSFTYNLAHYVEDITGKLPDVYKNDEITVDEIKNYDIIILSPGPGLPSEAGILKEVIRTYAGKIPILGVCLGLQAIVEVFGGKLKNLDEVFHGVASTVNVMNTDSVLFKDISEKFEVGRYHSWVASKNNFPKDLEVTCEDKFGNIMAIKHKKHKIEAVQFHPESILTPFGKKMMANFINSIN
ncbi:MAG: aminodeoxychorismate/anthranilate synthase component II [Tenacibaculum sp.]|nr:aminodeoxychorismate/anthranilate synthase component II [Tenacibaculum sp.]